MMKWLIGTGLILIVVLACVYIFIPPTLTVSRVAIVKCNAEGAFRVLGQDSNWKKWWSGEMEELDGLRIDAKYYPHIVLTAGHKGDSLPGDLFLLNLGRMDSIALQWRFSLQAGNDPVSRVRGYYRAVDVRKKMIVVLGKMKAYLENKELVYNMKVWEGMSKDSSLVVTEVRTIAYPSTAEIYKAVKALRAYIAGRRALETDPPMLHVGKDSAGYLSTVAVPVDRSLPGAGAIYPRRYVPWKVVIGEVRGGAYTAERGMKQLDDYLRDHRKVAMAMPHQSLVTERDQEPDTSRWVTQVVQSVP